MNAPVRVPAPLDAASTWTAADLGSVISEAFHDCNDMDGPHWPTVARKVADATGFPLSDQTGVRDLDLIWEAVNALGGGDPTDPHNVAIGKVLDLIEALGGRDPGPIRHAAKQASRALSDAA